MFDRDFSFVKYVYRFLQEKSFFVPIFSFVLTKSNVEVDLIDFKIFYNSRIIIV